MPRFRFVVSGRVQGVGFRYFAWRAAQGLGLSGWVENRRDGTVAGEAQGSEENLEKFWTALRDGPGAARVAEVRTQAAPVQERAGEFVIL